MSSLALSLAITLSIAAPPDDRKETALVKERADEVEKGPQILKALRRSLDVMFPDRPVTEREKIRIGERQAKSIFLHAYMDRYDFDLERLRKCCHHYPQIDSRIMPACGFNMFHRGAAKGPNTPVPKSPRLAVIA